MHEIHILRLAFPVRVVGVGVGVHGAPLHVEPHVALYDEMDKRFVNGSKNGAGTDHFIFGSRLVQPF